MVVPQSIKFEINGTKVSILIQTTKFSTKKWQKGAQVPDPIAPLNSNDLTSIWRKITQKENEWSDEKGKLMTYDIVMNVYIWFLKVYDKRNHQYNDIKTT